MLLFLNKILFSLWKIPLTISSLVRKEGNSGDVMRGFGYGDTLLGNRLLGLQGNARPRPRPSAIPLALALYLSRVGSDLKTSEEK